MKPVDRENIKKHKDWFWEIFSGFDDELRAQYLKFVWARTRLPLKLTTEKHKVKIRSSK